MRTAKYLLTLTAAILIVTGCDWVRSQLGMTTSEEMEALRREQIRQQQERRINDSIAQVRADSLQSAVADSLAREAEKGRPLFDSQNRFHVILGSFRVYSNSERMVESLKSKGYKPVAMDFKNGFRVVSVKSFGSINAAFNEMYKLLDADIGPDDIWVYDTRQNLHTTK